MGAEHTELNQTGLRFVSKHWKLEDFGETPWGFWVENILPRLAIYPNMKVGVKDRFSDMQSLNKFISHEPFLWKLHQHMGINQEGEKQEIQ